MTQPIRPDAAGPRPLVWAIILAVVLIAGSPPRLVGDGGEYLVMALNFAGFSGPSIGRQALPHLTQRVAEFDSSLGEWDVDAATVPGADQRRDFLHFWFYSLLAAPALWVTDFAGVAPTYAFAVVNVTLLSLAFFVAWPRLGKWLTVLVFAGPIIWWVDKAHTEAFTFSLLTIAVLLMLERPWWSLVALGAATTQNLPVGVLFLGVAMLAVWCDRTRLLDRRFQWGLAVGSLLVLLHPVYTYARHGTSSLLLRATRPGMPSWAEISAVAIDPQIGLLPSFPALGLVAIGAVVLLLRRRPKVLVTLEMALCAGAATFFLFAFARTTNLHHGATPGLSRYGLWLIPLALPVLRRANDFGGRGWHGGLRTVAMASAFISVFAFHPRIPQYWYEPSALAKYLWAAHPGWYNPIPEVFIETTLHHETASVPVATPGCEKILFGGGGTIGAWPIPCAPGDAPDSCLRPGALCYANRDGQGYAFAPAPGRFAVIPQRTDGVWPSAIEPHVRRVWTRWQVNTLSVALDGPAMLRAADAVHVTTLEGPARVVLVLQTTGAGASLTFRAPVPLTGELVDATTGEPMQSLSYDGPPGDVWRVALPDNHPWLLLRLDKAS